MLKLPIDCENYYYDKFLNYEESKIIYDHIIENYEFKRQSVKTKNNTYYKLNRSTVIFTDIETLNMGIIPKTWGEETPIIIWSKELIKQNVPLKQKIENLTGKKYNICLCNFYENGKSNIGWHSDKEEYGSVSSIASISIGAEREFSFRKIDDFSKIYSIILKHGSLLIMGENCQEKYQHRIIPDKKIIEPRINGTFCLTFRLFNLDRYLN